MKPILFNTEMVQAILDGRKTVTRRVVKPQPKMQLSYICLGENSGKWSYPSPNCVEQSGWDEKYRRIDGLTAEDDATLWTPPCHAGDILYVRETWRIVDYLDNASLKFEYLADGKISDFIDFTNLRLKKFLKYISNKKWCPSLFMPKEAARIFLRVTDVGVERLQDITEGQARTEGAPKGNFFNDDKGAFFELRNDGYYAAGFEHIWDSTVKKADLDKYGWAANPFVWVIAFERISKEEARGNA